MKIQDRLRDILVGRRQRRLNDPVAFLVSYELYEELLWGADATMSFDGTVYKFHGVDVRPGNWHQEIVVVSSTPQQCDIGDVFLDSDYKIDPPSIDYFNVRDRERDTLDYTHKKTFAKRKAYGPDGYFYLWQRIE